MEQKSDACVWVLDPWSLNDKVARRGNRIIFPDERVVQGYASPSVTSPRPPIALAAPLKSRRIAAQKGVFTLHGTSMKGIEMYTRLRDSALLRIDVASSAIDRIHRSLTRAGITETTVFPELSGLTRELQYYWRDEY